MAKKIKCPNPACGCVIELAVDDQENLVADFVEPDKPVEKEEKEEPVKDENDIINEIIGGFDSDDDSPGDDDEKETED